MKRQHNQFKGSKPAGWLYWPLALLANLLLRLFFRLRIQKQKALRKLKGPLLVIGNHPSYLDPLLMAVALLPRKISFLATRDLFRSRMTGLLLRLVGVIPKTQFRTDTQAVKTILRTIRGGGAVAIYPEGQRSIDGCLQPIDDSIFKLIKKAGCPVVLVMEHGAYLSWPRWARGFVRPGRIQVDVRLLLTGETIRQESVEFIRRQVLRAMSYHEYHRQKQDRYRYRTRRPADDMACICHQCPSCDQELAMQSAACSLTCRFCGNQGLVDETGLIRPAPVLSGQPPSRVWPDLARWHQWQLERLGQETKKPGFSRAYSAVLSWPDEPYNDRSIPGTLTLADGVLSFSGQEDDQQDREEVLEIPVANRNGISAAFGHYFDIAFADRVFRFVVEPGQAVIVLADTLRAYES